MTCRELIAFRNGKGTPLRTCLVHKIQSCEDWALAGLYSCFNSGLLRDLRTLLLRLGSLLLPRTDDVRPPLRRDVCIPRLFEGRAPHLRRDSPEDVPSFEDGHLGLGDVPGHEPARHRLLPDGLDGVLLGLPSLESPKLHESPLHFGLNGILAPNVAGHEDELPTIRDHTAGGNGNRLPDDRSVGGHVGNDNDRLPAGKLPVGPKLRLDPALVRDLLKQGERRKTDVTHRLRHHLTPFTIILLLVINCRYVGINK